MERSKLYQQIGTVIARHFGVEYSDLTGKVKRRDIIDARQFLWYFLNDSFGISAQVLASDFCASKRNVYYAIATIRDGLRTQSFYSRNNRQIENEILKSGLVSKLSETRRPRLPKVKFAKMYPEIPYPEKHGKGYTLSIVTRDFDAAGNLVYGTGVTMEIPIGCVVVCFPSNTGYDTPYSPGVPCRVYDST